MANPEAPYSPAASGTGPPFHVVNVTAMVNGVPTVIGMEAISLSDEFGNLITSFQDYNWQRRVIEELAGIREQLCLRNGVPFASSNT